MGVIPSRMMPMGVFKKPAPPLPYDAEVEYIESTGTQYIDTGVTPSTTGAVSVDLMPLSGSDYALWGARGSAVTDRSFSAFVLTSSAGKIRFDLRPRQGYSGTIVDFAPAFGSRHVFEARANAFFVDGAWAASVTAHVFVAGGPLTLFAALIGNTPGNFLAARLYGASYSLDGSPVLGLVPVRIGQVGYLYDKANPTGGPSGNGLYGSATASPLIAGPDVE